MYAKEDLENSKTLARIRDPIRHEDREQIAQIIRFRKHKPMGCTDYMVAGEDRSFDKASDVYGNSYHNFMEDEEGKMLNGQEQAEFFLVMCFTDTVLRMMGSRALTEEQAESVIWMAKMGMLTSAAAAVQYMIRKEEKDDA